MLIRKLPVDTTEVKTEVLYKLLSVTEAMLQGDFTKRVVVDYDDEMITRIADNINKFCDHAQVNDRASSNDLQHSVSTFIEVISSYANLDFKQKLPISENGTIMDAIATGINILGDELEQTAISKAELEREKDRLDEAQALARIGSWDVDMKTFALSLSKEAYRILELPDVQYTDFKRLYEDYRHKIHPADVAVTDRMLTNLIMKGSPFAFEHRMITTNGDTKFILCIGEVVHENDSVRILKGTFQDVTQRKQVEKDLQRAKEYAEESNRAKSMFLANMSHEIRTPLNGILGLTDLMLREEITQEQKNYLQLIQHSGKNLSQLINDILDLSKIESGKLVLENIPFHFKEVIESTVNPYGFLAQEKGLTFRVKVDEQIPKHLMGDPTRIAQILVNLVGNAIKFTESGGIDIEFGLVKTVDGRAVVIGVVRDTGIGIPKEKLNMIFDTFSQADDAITRKFGGTGLGLSIVKKLLLQMGGGIRIESPAYPGANSGSAFIFELPLTMINNAEFKPTQGSAGQKLSFDKSFQVLVVDDNKVNLLVASKILEKLGATVYVAESAADGLIIARTQPLDVILMDIQMPEINGYEAARQLRKESFEKPIIALSANAYHDDVQNSLSAGMNDHLQKPFTERQLFDIIQKHVD